LLPEVGFGMNRSQSLPPGQGVRAAAASTSGQDSLSPWRSPGSSTSLSGRSQRFRKAVGVRRCLDNAETDGLPALSKGALRHRAPAASNLSKTLRSAAIETRNQVDLDAAENIGRKALGEDDWVRRLFEEADGAACGYLWPSEFAALSYRMEQAMEGFHGRFAFDFNIADSNLEGRMSLPEWRDYSQQIIEVFGETRCRAAAQRVIGMRKAEMRKKVKNVFFFEGYDSDASHRLLDICSKGYKNQNLVESVRSALAAKADPNAGLTSGSYNSYTPLIFLAMTPPGTFGGEIATAMHVLVAAKADVHRECGQTAAGRLVPIRFAARLQNMDGLAALQQHVNVGDVFNWAAGENAIDVLLSELAKVYGDEASRIIKGMDKFSNDASVQLRLFASTLVGGSLSASSAAKLCNGTFDDGFVRLGDKANPNSPGLEGKTALLYMVMQGNVEIVEALLQNGADVDLTDSSGATPLHYAACYAQPAVARVLLNHGAKPHAVDHAGLSPWMVVGEAKNFYIDRGRIREAGLAEKDALKAPVRDLLELLKPRWGAEELIDLLKEDPEQVLQMLDAKPTIEALEEKLRLGESLFFNPRMAITGAHEGRKPRKVVLMRLATVLNELLYTDPLEGPLKILTRYLLTASIGPNCNAACAHVHRQWDVEDNRSDYRSALMETVNEQLGVFAAACGAMRNEIDAAAALAESAKHALGEEGEEEAEPVEVDEFSMACAELLRLPSDKVDIPPHWCRDDPYWEAVQKRNLLRFDPIWARQIHDGASACYELLRLGVPKDPEAAALLKSQPEVRAVTNLSEYSALRQVAHAPMQELIGRGFVTYSNLCNELFQTKMKEVAARAQEKYNLHVAPPKQVVGAKKLKRIMEKTRDAVEDRQRDGHGQWPNRPDSYLKHAHCFYILDTVRLSFGCGGETVPEQVACCMKLLQEFESCTLETDKVQLLRKKSGFSANAAKGDGGYADVKMLVYADLGTHVAFDGTEIPLQIVGEVQLILEGYEAVKHRMHLVYEVKRGSFDRKH